MSKATQMKGRPRSRGQDDDDYSSNYTSRPTDKKRRSSSTTRSANMARKALPRHLTEQELQEFVHLDIKRTSELPHAAVPPKHTPPAAPVCQFKTSSKTVLPSLSLIPSCSPLTWASSLSASSSVPDPSSRRPVKADPRLPVSSLRAKKPSVLSPPINKTERQDSFSFSSPPQTRQQKHKQDPVSASSHLTRETELRLNTSNSSRVSKRGTIVKPKSILKTTSPSSSYPATPASSSTRISMPTAGLSPTRERASFGGTVLPAWPTAALAAASPASTPASDAEADVDIVLDSGIRPSSSTVYTVHAKHGLQQPSSLSAPTSPVPPPDAKDHPRAVSVAKRHLSSQSLAKPSQPETVSEVSFPSKDPRANFDPPSLCPVSKVAGPLPPVRSEPASSVHILYMPGWGSPSVSRDPRLRSKRSASLSASVPASPTTTTTPTPPVATPERVVAQNSDDHIQEVKATLKSAIHIVGQAALHLALVRPRDLLSCVLDIDTTIAEMEQHLSNGLKIARDVWYLESQPSSQAATQGALWLMLQNTIDTPQSPLTVSCTSNAIARPEQCFSTVDAIPSAADKSPHFKDSYPTQPVQWSIALAVPQAPHDHSERRMNGLLKFVKAIQFFAGKQQDVLISLPDQRRKAQSSFLPALSFTVTSDTPVVSSQEIASCTSPVVEGEKPRQRSRISSLDDHGYFSDLSDADLRRTPSSSLTSCDAMGPPSATTLLPDKDQLYPKLLKGEIPLCQSPVSSSPCFIDLTASDDDDDDCSKIKNNNSNIDLEQWVPRSFGRFFDSITASPVNDSPSVLKQEPASRNMAKFTRPADFSS